MLPKQAAMATRPANQHPSMSNFPAKQIGLVVLTLFIIPFSYLLFVYYPIESDLRHSISFCLAMSLAGFVISIRLIPLTARFLLTRNMFGYDIGPQGPIKVPQPLGIVTGIAFLIVAILFDHFNFAPDSSWLVEYNAALACISFMTLLGFVDDILNVPWKMKWVLPSFAALPLLITYDGPDSTIIPYIGLSVYDLGCIYVLHMVTIAVFCTNSIRLHGGLNSLHVGQTVVISFAILVHNIMEIGTSIDPKYKQAHAFSIYIVLPLFTTSLSLLSFNWYPSSVFVGDTYAYFAGMTLAAAGILGHFSGALLVFFLPQVLNFLYSCPQLLEIVPCPRYRLPRFDQETGLLTASNDLTLVNLFLRLFGPCSEKVLCIRLLIFQALSCLLYFGLRYILMDATSEERY